MSKLIDAEKLVVDLVRLDGTPASKIGQNLRAIVVNQPDASEPLRLDAARTMRRLEDSNTELQKRIAELEEALRVNADLVRDYALYDNPTPEQVENGLMMSANVLLKGGQDA